MWDQRSRYVAMSMCMKKKKSRVVLEPSSLFFALAYLVRSAPRTTRTSVVEEIVRGSLLSRADITFIITDPAYMEKVDQNQAPFQPPPPLPPLPQSK